MNRATLVAAVLGLCAAADAGRAEDWTVLKGKHFVIHFRQTSQAASEVLQQAEDDYARIADQLGYARRESFWLWEHRVHIFLYRDRAEFVRSTGAPGWAAGKASQRRREISGFEGSGGFASSVLPHEIAHLVFRDFVGFTGEVPLWLDEGVAQWVQPPERSGTLRSVKDLAARGLILPLQDLLAMDVRTVRDIELAQRFYAESVSLVGYLVEQGGAEKFAKLCRQLRDGKSMDDALKFTYPGSLDSIDALETNWRRSLGGTH